MASLPPRRALVQLDPRVNEPEADVHDQVQEDQERAVEDRDPHDGCVVAVGDAGDEERPQPRHAEDLLHDEATRRMIFRLHDWSVIIL